MGGLIPNIFILWHTGQRETCGHWRRFRNQGALATESSSQRMYHRLHAQACLNEIDHSSKIDTYCTVHMLCWASDSDQRRRVYKISQATFFSLATSPEKCNLAYACINSTHDDWKFAVIPSPPSSPCVWGAGWGLQYQQFQPLVTPNNYAFQHISFLAIWLYLFSPWINNFV